jgi:drug/metabolite transporter (DMT)-like permease
LAGFTAILGKLIHLHEGWLVAYRLLFTLLILGIWLYWQGSSFSLKPRLVLRIFFIGSIVAAHWLCFYASIKYANASIALVCLAANGIFTALIEPVMVKRRWVPAEILLGLLSLAGIYIIFDFHPHYKMGIIFGIVSALGSSIFPVLNKQLVNLYPPRIITFYEMMGALLTIVLFLPIYLNFFPADQWQPTFNDFAWLLVLSLLCTVISFDLQLRSLRRLSAFTSNLTYNLEPVYGIFLAFLLLDEAKHFKSGFYIGILLVAAAVGLQVWRVGRERSKRLAELRASA